MTNLVDTMGRTGGAVIAFPGRKTEDAATRLDRALAGLLRATQEQAAAVATWRAALAELNARMADLAASANTYRERQAEAARRIDG